VAADLGLPLVVRPSYVLGGRAMQIIREETQLGDYLLGTFAGAGAGRRQGALSQRQDRPDQHRARKPIRCCSTAICPTPSRSTSTACATARTPFIVGIMEHIEEAGIHSGDSACSLPPHSIDAQMISELERQDARAGARARRGRD